MAHKKHKRKYLNILLIPDDESTTRNLRVRYSLLTALIVVLIIVGIWLIVGAITYGALIQKALENISLKQENRQLKIQLQKVNDLEKELEELRNFNQKVRKSLTGYVKLEDGSENIPSVAQQQESLENSRLSIFTFVPVIPPVRGFVSQGFKRGVHNGIDIVAPVGTPIVAAADGTVLYSDWTLDGGYTIIISHGFGYYTYYKHNLRNVVYANQKVTQGQVIGYLGNSGQKSYGPHLHFEIWKDGKPIDPEMLNLDFK